MRDRKLVQWALAYLAGAWLVLQVIEVVSSRWPVPLGVQRGADVILAVGFVAALVVAWHHGERGRQRVSGAELLSLAVLLAIAAALIPLLQPEASVEPQDSQTTPATHEDGRRGVAVLPLRSLGGPEVDDYLAEGVHESIITDLSKIRSLRVISRTSVMPYRGVDRPPAEIAEVLDVEAIVEGTILRQADSIRVSARLIDPRTGTAVWSATFEREMARSLSLTAELARSVASQLAVAMSSHEEARLASGPVDPFAFDAYLQGRSSLTAFRYAQALRHFEEALAIDSTFAAARAGQASALYQLVHFGAVSGGEAVERARAAAARALALDPDLSDAYAVLGFIRLYFDWDWAGAEQAFERALELGPSDPLARHGYADLLTVTGRADQAVT